MPRTVKDLRRSVIARKKTRIRLSLEPLETRNLLSVYTPAQVLHAYGFDQVKFANGTVRGDGSGQTIAIVDAYDNPQIATSLQTFDRQFGLADPPSFTKVNQTGGSTLPAFNSGWASEIALDVEWAHAVAPGAKILLVEAKSTSFSDLLAAVDYAARQPGVSVVSMSWGSGEFSGEQTYDGHFTTPAGHAGVTFVASSGDSGAPPEWPAVSPNVVAVGGTRLSADSSGNYLSETGWGSGSLSWYYGGSGGGISKYESKPSYQSSVTQSSTRRTSPDVAYDADPNSGYYVYDAANGGWFAIGGTSAGAPQWAGLIAITNQGRALSGQGSLDGRSQTLPDLYKLSSADFHDVTSGNNGYSATAGYDLVTGRGSPRADRVISDLVGQTTQTAAATTTGGTTTSHQTTTFTIWFWHHTDTVAGDTPAAPVGQTVAGSAAGTPVVTAGQVLVGLPALTTADAVPGAPAAAPVGEGMAATTGTGTPLVPGLAATSGTAAPVSARQDSGSSTAGDDTSDGCPSADRVPAPESCTPAGVVESEIGPDAYLEPEAATAPVLDVCFADAGWDAVPAAATPALDLAAHGDPRELAAAAAALAVVLNGCNARRETRDNRSRRQPGLAGYDND